MTRIVPFLALIWGFAWAIVLQALPLGRFLAARRTWLTVVIGVGGDLILLRPLLPLAQWLRVLAVVAASAVGIVGRSLINEWRAHEDLLATIWSRRAA